MDRAVSLQYFAVTFLHIVGAVTSFSPFQEYGGKIGVVSTNSTFKFVGDTLDLYCNITNLDIPENSSMLYFDRKTFSDYSVIPAEYVEILTTKAIRLQLHNLDISDDGAYGCNLSRIGGGQDVVGHKIIKVDYKPRRVENVTCRVYNWEEMNCTWDLGVKYQHPEYINVSLAWTIHGDQRDCPNLTNTSCLWDRFNYQHAHQYYMVIEVKTIVDKQVLMEEKSPQFRIETVLYVEPAPVDDFQAVVENSTCIQLRWRHSSSTKRLKFFVAEYKQPEEEDWEAIILDQNNKGQNYNSLKCDLIPYTKYQFRMSVLPYPEETREPVNQGHRSQWKIVENETLEDVPGASPEICMGCFHKLICSQKTSHSCYRIYWQDLEEEDKHGILTHYDISYNSDMEENSHSVPPLHIAPSEIIVSYDLEELNPDFNYHVTVRPATRRGPSINSSSLFLPSYQNRPNPPKNFLVEKDKGDEDVRFYLSWAALSADEKSGLKYSGILVVWCIGVQTEPKCIDDIHWKHLEPDQVTYELMPENKDLDSNEYLIGITAEVVRDNQIMSSGIQWSPCVYLRNQAPQNSPKNVREAPHHPPNGLTILWDKLTCAEERTFITEYLVKYCPSNKAKKCLEAEKTQNVSNAYSEVTLIHLKADSRYTVIVMAVSAAGLGPEGQLFSQAVTDAPPESEEPSDWWIILAVIVLAVVLVVVILVVCYRYCLSRRKRIPKAEGLIEPYAQTQAFTSKKSQDFRNRPLPKTPEDQHFYGSSACMNNHGSNKIKDNRHSESSSEGSVTSHTNLLSAQNVQLSTPNQRKRNSKPHTQMKGGSSKELKSLLDPDHAQNSHHSSDKDQKDNKNVVLDLKVDSIQEDYSTLVGLLDGTSNSSGRPSAKLSANLQHVPEKSSSSNTSAPSSESVEEYVHCGLDGSNESSGNRSSSGPTDPTDPNEIEFSSMSTLPLRECVHPQLSVYPVLATQNVPVINSLQSSVLGGHGKANDISQNAPRTRHNPKNPAYIRKYRPSLCAVQNPQLTNSPEQSSAALTNEYVTAPPNMALNSIAGPLNDSSASNNDSPEGYSSVVDAFGNKRGSALLSSILHFPPPPTSPPPSPCPEDTQYAAYLASLPPLSSPSQYVSTTQPTVSSSSDSRSNPASSTTSQPSAIHVNDYIPHSAHSTITPSQSSDSSNSVPSEMPPTISIDYLPHDSHMVFQQRPNHMPLSMVSDYATLPRTMGQNPNTLPLPSPLSRPLSGDLLELPPVYYQDPTLGGSNQILTEL